MSCVPPSAHLNMPSGAYRADTCSTNCRPTSSSPPHVTDGGTTEANGAACTIMSGTWRTEEMPRQNGTDASRASCRPIMSLKTLIRSRRISLVSRRLSLTISRHSAGCCAHGFTSDCLMPSAMYHLLSATMTCR